MKVTFDRSEESGNIFYIMGAARKVLRMEGRNADAETMLAQVRNCHSYEDALLTIAEYVDLEEVRHEYAY